MAFMSESEHSFMASLLKKGVNVRNRDRANFHRYETGMITIEQSLKDFRQNNEVGDRVDIPINLYYRWLLSLGYIRIGE